MMAVPKEYQYLTRSSSEAGPHAGKNLFLCNAAGDPLDIKSAILFETKVKPEDGLTSKDAFFDHAERSKAFVVNNKEALLREPYPVTTLNQALQVPENRTLEEAFPEKEIFRIEPVSTLLYPENENPAHRPTIKRAGIFAEENTSPIACLSSDSMIFRLTNSDLEIVYSPLPTDIQLAKLQESPGVKIDLREIFNGRDIEQLLTDTFSKNPSYLLVKGDKHYIASADQLKDHHEINAITYPSDTQTVVQVLAHVGLIPKNESLSPPSDKLYAFRIHVSGKHPNTLLSIETDSHSIPLVRHANSKFLIKLGEPDYSIGTHAVDAEEDTTKTLFDKITHSHQSHYFEILRMFAKENIQCTNSISDSSPLLHVPQGESYSTKHAHYYNRSGVFYRISNNSPFIEGMKIFHGPSLLHTVHANQNGFVPLALEIAPNARSYTNWIISKSFLEQNPATGDRNPDTHTTQKAEEKSDSNGSNNTSENRNTVHLSKKDAVDKPHVNVTQKAEEKSDSHGSNNTSDNSNKTNATKKDAVDKPHVNVTQKAEEKSDSHGSNNTSENRNTVHLSKKDAVDKPHVNVTQKAEQESEKFFPGPTALIFQSPKTDADETYSISSVHSSSRKSIYGTTTIPMHGCHFTEDNKLLCGDDFATTFVIPPEYHFLKVVKNTDDTYGLTFCNATNKAILPSQLENVLPRPPLLAKLKSLVAADGKHTHPTTKNTLGANLEIVNNLLLHPNPPGPAELQQIFHTQKGNKPAFKIVNEEHAAIVSPLNSISSDEKRWLSAGTEYFYKNQDYYYLVQDGVLIKKIPIIHEPPSNLVIKYTGFIIVDSNGVSLQHSPSSDKDAHLVRTNADIQMLQNTITNIAYGSNSMQTRAPIMAEVFLPSNLVNAEGPSGIYLILSDNNRIISAGMPLEYVKFFPEIFTLVYQPGDGSASVVLATDTNSLLRSASGTPIQVQESVRTIEKLLALEMQDVEAPTTTTETITPTDDGASGKKPTFVDPDQPKVPGVPTVTKDTKVPGEPTVTKETKGTELPTVTKESKGPVEPTV
ncbi:hypothetical protein, partial [Anaplasma phagocytophilum]|uniref:hypothetical protein n=1 Tax=Anaplasma phagocytophilum TaxID=948 RepID=UPI00114CFB94